PRPALEPPLDEPRDIVDEKTERAADLRRVPLKFVVSHSILHMRHVTRRHGGPQRERVGEDPKGLRARATGGRDGQPSARVVQDTGRSPALCTALTTVIQAVRRRLRYPAAGAVRSPRLGQKRSASRRTVLQRSSS